MTEKSNLQWLSIHPISLLILVSCSLWNSCTAIFISYPGGYVAGINLAIGLRSSGYFLGVDVNPPWRIRSKMHMVWMDMWWPFGFILPGHFQKCDLPAWPEISCEIPEACANAASHLAFAVPGHILNASLLKFLNACCRGNRHFWHLYSAAAWIFSKIACCFSSRVDRCLISSRLGLNFFGLLQM